MRKTLIVLLLMPVLYNSFSQQNAFNQFITDPALRHAEIGFCLAEADSGRIIFEYNPEKSLVPASVMKLITSAAALELLGPGYTFKTVVGYTGALNPRSGRLNGDIVIKGGGDPALGSPNFTVYSGFEERWISEIKLLGIRKIKGRVISDDSYYDYLPVPAKWLWEDAGNYYGAGAYGLSVYDNTYEIHFKTTSGTPGQMITGIIPGENNFEFTNWLAAKGTSDEGYVFAAPYSTSGWLAGTIPANRDDFVLKASITDPPGLMSKIIDKKLEEAGIIVSGEPSTARLLKTKFDGDIQYIAETVSPPLRDIVEVLNHESVNLYAEHLLKELGKHFRENGSTGSGIEVVYRFLSEASIDTTGIFIVDGSGVSPLNALNPVSVVHLLRYMRNNGKYSGIFMNSLPEAGKEGTLKSYFKDPIFGEAVRAKSGSMTRVRNYAGYIRTTSGKDLIFCMFVTNYTGTVKDIVSGIENILMETILNN